MVKHGREPLVIGTAFAIIVFVNIIESFSLVQVVLKSESLEEVTPN